jgi:two-component system sporulation sensor kinase B
LDGFNELLYNVLIIIVPILLYEIFWADKLNAVQPLRGRVLICAVCAVTALFCMTHPITCWEEYFFDLRFIPLLMAFLYGGTVSGISVALAILVFRYFVGGPGFLVSLLVVLFIVPFTIWSIRWNNWHPREPKVAFPVMLSFFAGLSVTGVASIYRVSVNNEVNGMFFAYFGTFCLLHTLTMWVIMTLLENIRINSVMRLEIQRSEKLNVLSELAASVAHEIRNPMTVARGFMQILSQSEVSEEKKKAYTSMVIAEIDRAQNIISDYLSFAKPQADKMDSLSASDIIQHVMNLISPYASMRDVRVECYITEVPMSIKANRQKFVQCLVNVAKNGIEAMPEGGVLRINAVPAGDNVRIDIKDSGVGMTEEEIARLGTPFYETKQKGTGLSMMVAYRIIESLGGSIQVKSEPGKGTLFTITVPQDRKAS